METYTVATFGEAEKGDYSTPYFCRNLPELIDCLGNPPSHSHGLHCAIQALLYRRNLIFLRVREEGFSFQDYANGLKSLERSCLLPTITAVCLPGVGEHKILDLVDSLCLVHHHIILTNEADLYDYLVQ